MHLMSKRAVHDDRVAQIQQALQGCGNLDGWLFYDFRVSDPLAYRILKLDAGKHVTRRWYYWVPATGTPVKLLHRIEPRQLEELPGATRLYVGWQEQRSLLAEILRGARRVAMQYSPQNAVPYISRVDAGTIELIRSLGTEVATSADLVQRFEAVWDDRQLASHREAVDGLRQIVTETFGHVAAGIRAGTALCEYDVQQFILSRMKARSLMTGSAPIAAVNAHSADPHYTPEAQASWPVREGDLLLIDLWAKRPELGSVYGDITWTGYVGQSVPDRYRRIFELVRDARDAALSFARDRVTRGEFPCGWEVDDVCRAVIRDAGYGDQFLHRTGHSIGEEVHGNGANIDNLETQDTRRLIPRTCFSIEPGVYLAGDFGIRSELDAFVTENDVLVFGQPLQTELVPILKSV
ncbi:MAG: aminopeptidase P family protein [Nitrospira sp.]|nr:MAG: aminopeptidase P family protein [Nitrospira sp.]